MVNKIIKERAVFTCHKGLVGTREPGVYTRLPLAAFGKQYLFSGPRSIDQDICACNCTGLNISNAEFKCHSTGLRCGKVGIYIERVIVRNRINAASFFYPIMQKTVRNMSIDIG